MKNVKTKRAVTIAVCLLVACAKPKNELKPCHQAWDAYPKSLPAAKENTPKNPPDTVMHVWS